MFILNNYLFTSGHIQAGYLQCVYAFGKKTQGWSNSKKGMLWSHKIILNTDTLLLSSDKKPCRRAVKYMCVRSIHFASFAIFLFESGTVLTVWYFSLALLALDKGISKVLL